ncbi:MAG: glycosyltransferase family 39 protein, partial [Chloroflexi bacterium]|nr:glycosyltransferase family 39 protein [Chloroflexota bacterium]
YLLRAIHEHPPGYYVLLAGWIQLVGDSEVALRWLSVFIGTLSIPLMYRLARAAHGALAGWLAALILTVTPVHIFYSQNARMYVLLSALAVVSWWLILKLQRADRPRNWLALAAACFYGLGTHYYMGLVIASQAVYLGLTWRQNKRLFIKWLIWLGVPLGAAALYVLSSSGVMATLQTMFEAGLGSAVTVGSLRALAADLVFGPHGNLGIAVWLIVLAAVGLGVGVALRGRSGRSDRSGVPRSIGVLLACAIVVPLVLVCLAPETLAVRYVLFLVFPMILALVIVIEWPQTIALRQPRWRPVLVAASAVLLLTLLALNVSRLPNHYQALNSDYGRTVRFVCANYRPGDGVIFYGPWQVIMQYYYPIGPVPYLYLPPQAPPVLDPVATEPQLAEWLRTYRRLWVIPVSVPPADPARFVTTYLNQAAHQALDQPNVALYYAPTLTLTTIAPALMFDDELELAQLEMAAGPIAAGDALVTTLTWRVRQSLRDAIQVTLDVIDQAGQVWGQRIYQAGEDTLAAGQPLIDRQAVPIGLGAPPGEYRLRVTVQWVSSGKLLAVRDQPDPDRAVLATVQMVTPDHLIADDQVPGVHVDAQVGPGLQLIAYRLPADQFVQAGVVPVTLYWRALAGDRPARVDVALTGPDDAPVDVSSGPLGPAWYPADRWRTSEVIATSTALRIPSRGTPGTYTLSVSARDEGEHPIEITGTLKQPGFLWLWTDRAIAQHPSWPLGSLTVAARDRVFDRPVVQTLLTVKFGDELQLIGYALDVSDARPGGRLRVTYVWQALKSIERNYVVFNHLLDVAGTQRGQQDSMPVGGLNPTPFWQAGEYIRDEYVIEIAPEAAAGGYTLDFGWYDSDTGVRLPAVGAAGERYRDDIVKLPHIAR